MERAAACKKKKNTHALAFFFANIPHLRLTSHCHTTLTNHSLSLSLVAVSPAPLLCSFVQRKSSHHLPKSKGQTKKASYTVVSQKLIARFPCCSYRSTSSQPQQPQPIAVFCFVCRPFRLTTTTTTSITLTDTPTSLSPVTPPHKHTPTKQRWSSPPLFCWPASPLFRDSPPLLLPRDVSPLLCSRLLTVPPPSVSDRPVSTLPSPSRERWRWRRMFGKPWVPSRSRVGRSGRGRSLRLPSTLSRSISRPKAVPWTPTSSFGRDLTTRHRRWPCTLRTETCVRSVQSSHRPEVKTPSPSVTRHRWNTRCTPASRLTSRMVESKTSPTSCPRWRHLESSREVPSSRCPSPHPSQVSKSCWRPMDVHSTHGSNSSRDPTTSSKSWRSTQVRFLSVGSFLEFLTFLHAASCFDIVSVLLL